MPLQTFLIGAFPGQKPIIHDSATSLAAISSPACRVVSRMISRTYVCVFVPRVCRIKKGKCQFQYCDSRKGYNFFGNKHFDSYVFSGPVLEATLVANTADTSTTSIARTAAVVTAATGCANKCIGDLTCDDLVSMHGPTCARIEQALKLCDCGGCQCTRK